MIQFLWKTYLRLSNPSCRIRAAAVAKHVKFEKGVTVEFGSHIAVASIGKYTYINKYCLIDKNTSSIGRFCSIAYGCKIGLGSHPTDWVSTHPFAYHKKYGFRSNDINFDNSKTETIIGNDVWMGANATILAGVTVGDGAIIGANAIVNSDVEPYAVVIGAPARTSRMRFDEQTIQKLLATKWWTWDDDQIKERIEQFNSKLGILD